MSTLTQDLMPRHVAPATVVARDSGRDTIACVTIHSDIAEVADLWRDFERHAVGTPYQHQAFVAAFAPTVMREKGIDLAIAVAHDRVGNPIILAPLAIQTACGFRIASPAGGKHVSFHMPLIAPLAAATMDANAVRGFLTQAAQSLNGIDAFVFRNLPQTWQGYRNPFASLAGGPSPSNGHKLALDGDGEKTLRRVLGKDTRKKLRRKQRALAAIGPLAVRKAATRAEAEIVLAAFLAQKARRFREVGIGNPFACEAVQDFLRRGTLTGLEQCQEAIGLYALWAGDRILASFGATRDGSRFCGMFSAFDTSPDIARWSPGDVLLMELIRMQCLEGFKTFDLGVGEARYKRVFCDRAEPLLDVFLPVTLRGVVYCGVARVSGQAKRWIKRTEWAWRLARHVQARAASRTA